MVEFTGERVIPGRVEDDLWSEHVARYAFASRFAHGKRVLDCACGAGYGCAELAAVAKQVTAFDIAPEAVEFAAKTYSRPNIRYAIGSGLALPFPAASFDVVVAFELIEHLSEFRPFLEECARVLAPAGLFIVSTPNKSYYAESRAASGPNPFHQHEFEAAEFREELSRAFAHVNQLVQNRVECFAFPSGGGNVEARMDGDPGPQSEAHFFIALCSQSPRPQAPSFIYVPKSANLLRERERHIELLTDQLREARGERDQLIEIAARQKTEIEERNRWAESLTVELKSKSQRIDQLQRELETEQRAAAEVTAAYEGKVRELDTENAAKAAWAQELSAEIARLNSELSECVRLLTAAEQTIIDRTRWAQDLEGQKSILETQLNAVRSSRWVRAGRKLGVGPALQ